ncbi:GAF domain-containing protein [Gordonia polyisoprenivorans]|uniref:aspartate racemase/maleate isomerase family protein n=1 Tax=Gordonia polyisoprenivorans TaxID=84595 RepID=UPI003F8342AD
MIVPSSNTVVEPTTARMLAHRPDVTVVHTRIRVHTITIEGSGAAFDAESMVSAARLLADAGVDVIVWNGTAGSWLGVRYDNDICAAITAATGVPATTSTLAIIAACRAFGVTRLAVATPYTPDVVAAIAAEYATHGICVVSHAEWGLSDNRSFADPPPAQVAELLAAAVGDSAPEAVALICTNVDGEAVAGQMEHLLGIPVLDSVAATLWWALEASGGGAEIVGHATLLRQASFRRGAMAIVDELRRQLGCARVTLRVDHEELGLHVDTSVAEALAPGEPSMMHAGPVDQRSMQTVQWLLRHREVLVQNSFQSPPFPPSSLREVYGIAAQMLGPVEIGGEVTAWLSAHSRSERQWSAADVAAMDTAGKATAALIAGRDGEKR